MEAIPADVLLELIAASSEPMLVVRVDSPDWPVVLRNPAFEGLAGHAAVLNEPFPDVVEPMIGRDMTREASAALRTQHPATLPVDVGSREFLLTLLPISVGTEETAGYFAAYWQTASRRVSAGAGGNGVRALALATRRVRDLSGDDPVTGLMNERAFRNVLEHDWAVAKREKAALGLTVFQVDDFDAYTGVFGRHGADSCLRRIAKIVQRHLKRASDVAARIDDASGGCLLVLSHGSGETGLSDFAVDIADAVRDLGLHHPRSAVDRFVTVSERSLSFQPGEDFSSADQVLEILLSG